MEIARVPRIATGVLVLATAAALWSALIARPKPGGRTPLPLASALPQLRSDASFSGIEDIRLGDDRSRPVALAQSLGKETVAAIDPRTGRSLWRGRVLDVGDASTASIIGEHVVFLQHDGAVGVARLADGTLQSTVPGARCASGRLAGSGDMALVYCSVRGARDKAEWLGIDLAAGQVRYRFPEARTEAELACSGATCIVETIDFPHPPSGKPSEFVAYDLTTGKVSWRRRGGGFLKDVGGAAVVLTVDGGRLVVLDLATGRQRWMTSLRQRTINGEPVEASVAVGDGVIAVVRADAIESLDTHTGELRERHLLPPLPETANVELSFAGQKLLATIDRGGLGDGYLIVYDGARETRLHRLAIGITRFSADRVLVQTNDHTGAWNSYSLAPLRTDASVAKQSTPRQRLHDIVAYRATDEYTAEMLAIPDHDALIVELVAKAPPPTNIVALDALAQLHSPMLRAVCERVLEDAANPAQRNLVNTALLILESLDGPVPLSLLAPYLQSPYPEHVSDMTSDVVALLARGDADELRLLDSLYGTRANRLGWRDLCNGIDHDARLGDYGDVWQCRRNATNGEHSVAIATDRVWLRSPRLNGPAWLGTLALASPYRRFVEPWRYDVQSLQIDAHSVQLTGIERYQDSSKPVPFQFAAAVREPLRDSDHDGIPDDTERCLGTSPIANDSDGDGLLDPVDPSPLVKTEPADPRAAIVNAVLKHVARFEWSELESVAVL
ncbi:MAG TPA: PQQ-binding-like beta-propeller repeat protein, partial [Polyangia bacterium]|nr:PQQ-binding-like beta-propeller repeat protein [Polyangia bacterium]